MSKFTAEELHFRTYERLAWVLRHLWEEQQDDPKRDVRVHSRLFDVLVGNPRNLGKSVKGGGHKEHLVPCALLRNRAFEMFWEGLDSNKDLTKVENDVAHMLEKYLAIAHITKEEAHHLDHVLGFKTTMPPDWSWENGLVEARLNAANIKIL